MNKGMFKSMLVSMKKKYLKTDLMNKWFITGWLNENIEGIDR